VEITAIQRKRSEYSSSYDADIITVQLNTDEELKLFAKNFGVTRFPKDDPKQRRDRELSVYRDLLAEIDLGTAKYYGSVWDESQGIFWCLLEFVNGAEVRCYGLEYWVAAASWLAQLQAYFAHHLDRLNACTFLVRHDASFFQPKADLALREVGQLSVPLAHRLAPVLDCYDRLVEVLGNQPRTLVHGSYRPANILVDVTTEPMRICPIDWEMAALGSALYDLAYLTEGFPPLTLDRFLEAYHQEAVAYGLDVPDREEISHGITCFHYFMKIHLLSRGGERKLSEEKVAKTIQQLEHLHQVIWASKTNV
jgi:aminoglycoside phosphotransferase (APT) family kinase protein